MVEIRAPFVANIDLTNRCNLRCLYCYAANRGAVDIPTDRCIALVDELANVHNVFHITLAGGEPLLHPGILLILKECFSRHGDRLALLTNGTRLLDDKFYDGFRKVCVELDQQGQRLDVQISLDSHIPEVHDRQRDQGSRVIASIERALTLPITLQLACVVTRHNVHCAHEIVDAYYPRVMNFHYMNVMPSMGRSAGRRYWDLLPTREQIQEFHQRILERERRYAPVRITKIVRESTQEGGTLRARGCLAGTTRIDIGPDLKVYACCMSNETLGNLADQTFEEMWFSAQAERVRSVPVPYCLKWARSRRYGAKPSNPP